MKRIVLLFTAFTLFVSVPMAATKGTICFKSDKDYQIMHISSNGLWACGSCGDTETESSHYGFVWNLQTGKITVFDSESEANQVSDDGVVAGGFYAREGTAMVEKPGTWKDGQWTEFDMPEGVSNAWASAISCDGSLVTVIDQNYVPYIYSKEGKLQKALEQLGSSWPTCISPDGTMVGGWVSPSGSRKAGYWTTATGKFTYLEPDSKGSPWETVRRFSADSRKIFHYGGWGSDNPGKGNGIKAIYDLDSRLMTYVYPAEVTYTFDIFDMNGDATIVTGYQISMEGTQRAIIWTDGKVQFLEDWLEARGVDFSQYDILPLDSERKNLAIIRGVAVSNDGKRFGLFYYDSDGEIHSMVVMLEQETDHTRPIELHAEQVKRLNAVHLNWEAPVGDKSDLQGYNVYRSADGHSWTKANASLVTASEYYDSQLSPGNYTYTVKAQYSDTESEASDEVKVTVSEVKVSTVTDLFVRQQGYSDVYAEWKAPKSNLLPVSYVEDGVTVNGFGGGSYSFESATLFTKETMALYKELHAAALTFIPMSHQKSWTVSFYTTDDGETPLDTLCSIPLDDASLVIGKVNTVEIPATLNLSLGKDILIGIATEVSSSSYAVQGVYSDCLVTGRTDLIRMLGEKAFYAINKVSSSKYDMAWGTSLLLAAEGQTLQDDQVKCYRVYDGSQFLGSTADLSYCAPLSAGSHSIGVEAVYNNGKTSDQSQATLSVHANPSVLAVTPTVVMEAESSRLTLRWDAVQDKDLTPMGYCTDQMGGKSPVTSAVGTSIMARVDYTDKELRSYYGYQIESLSFMPMSDYAYALYVFVDDATEATASVFPKRVTAGEWNTFRLDSPLDIQEGSIYHFVVECFDMGKGFTPVATDNDLTANEYSDLYMLDVEEESERYWDNITSFGAGGNWMMRMNIARKYGKEVSVRQYDVVYDDNPASTTASCEYTREVTDLVTHTVRVDATCTVNGAQIKVEGTPVRFNMQDASGKSSDVCFGYTTQLRGLTAASFRGNSGNEQGLCIRLSKEKLKSLEGRKITGVRLVLGSEAVEDCKVFVAERLDGTQLRSSQFTDASQNNWKQVSFANPYVITGTEEQLFVGYTLTAADLSVKPLQADNTQDSRNLTWVLTDSGWQDSYGSGRGMANVEAMLSSDTSLPLSDVLIKTTRGDGFHKAGEPSDYAIQVYNCGTVTVGSLNVDVMWGDRKIGSRTFTNLGLEAHHAADLTLSQLVVPDCGADSLSVSVSKVDGAADADMSDNTASDSFFFYPEGTERNVLVEVFTGQTCVNCPNGHKILAQAIEQSQVPVVEVSHHSGFQSDLFTMTDDEDLLYLYGGATYAPAVTFNRFDVFSKQSVVMDSQTLDKDVEALNACAAEAPMVSLSLDAQYDSNTRSLNVEAQAFAHDDPAWDALDALLTEGSGGEYRFTVYLIQNGLVASQKGATTDYVHNAVCRGTITDGTLGEAVELKRGETTSLTWQLTLPEVITSSASTLQNRDIQVVDENMRLVFLVHQYGKATLRNRVLNAVEVRLGEKKVQKGFGEESGVKELPYGSKDSNGLNGPRGIYTLSGQKVDDTSTKGIYIINGRKVIR